MANQQIPYVTIYTHIRCSIWHKRLCENVKRNDRLSALLIASHLDIMFATILYARYQDNHKESHLHSIKRIFSYLKHTPILGYGIHIIHYLSWLVTLTLIVVDVVLLKRVLREEISYREIDL